MTYVVVAEGALGLGTGRARGQTRASEFSLVPNQGGPRFEAFELARQLWVPQAGGVDATHEHHDVSIWRVRAKLCSKVVLPESRLPTIQTLSPGRSDSTAKLSRGIRLF